MTEPKCPFCKKEMKRYKPFYGYKFGDIAKEKGLPTNVSNDEILYWYECKCRNNKKEDTTGHNRLIIKGKLYLYYMYWHLYGKPKPFIFR